MIQNPCSHFDKQLLEIEAALIDESQSVDLRRLVLTVVSLLREREIERVSRLRYEF